MADQNLQFNDIAYQNFGFNVYLTRDTLDLSEEIDLSNFQQVIPTVAVGATRNQVFEQDDAPNGGYQLGDLWIDTNDSNHMYRANALLQWVSVRDGTIATAAGTANWSEVVDDDANKPENNADVTSANTAAAIASQGALATLDAVEAAQIAANAVEEAKINGLAVTEAKIAADAVTATKINVVGLNGTTGRIIVADQTDADVVTGGVNSHAVTLINAGKILISGSTPLSDWSHGTDATKIDGGEIYTNTITATQINVATLSAISANVGTITAGSITGLTITGGTIQTSASANTGVKMTAAGGLDIYGETLEFRETDGTLQGKVYADSVVGIFVIDAEGALNINSGHATPQIVFQAGLFPAFDDTYNIGLSGSQWKNAYFDGTVQTDALRIDQTPTSSGSLTASHYITINCNGTLYRVMLDEN